MFQNQLPLLFPGYMGNFKWSEYLASPGRIPAPAHLFTQVAKQDENLLIFLAIINNPPLLSRSNSQLMVMVGQVPQVKGQVEHSWVNFKLV